MPGAIDEVKNKEFVQKRVDTVVTAAKSLYTRVEGSSRLVKMGLDTIDKSTCWLSRPLVHKLSQIGQPVLQSLDSGLSAAYASLDKRVHTAAAPADADADADAAPAAEVPAADAVSNTPGAAASSSWDLKERVVSSNWFKSVDAILLSKLPSPQQPAVQFKAFYASAVDAFASLDKKTYNDFAAALRGKLAHWDEALVTPAKQFYARALERYQALAADGKQVSREDVYRAVSNVFDTVQQHSAVANARTLYAAAIQHYLTFGAERKTPAELIAGMRAQLGDAWNDKLSKPLHELFANVRALAAKDLERLQQGIQQGLQHHGLISGDRKAAAGFQDVVHAGRDAVHSVTGLVHRGWASVLSFSGRTIDYWLPEDAAAAAAAAAASADKENTNNTATATPALGKVACQEVSRGAAPVDKDNDDDDDDNDNGASKSCEGRTLRELGNTVSNRLLTRAKCQWGKIRQLSATRVKSVLHVDLIQYAEQAIDTATARLHTLRSHTSRLLASSEDASRRALQQAIDRTSAALRAVKKSVDSKAADYKGRLSRVADSARALSAYALHVIGERRVLDAPHDVYVLFAKALGFRSKDPQFQGFVAELRELVSSVKNLVWLTPSALAERADGSSALLDVTLDGDDRAAEQLALHAGAASSTSSGSPAVHASHADDEDADEAEADDDNDDNDDDNDNDGDDDDENNNNNTAVDEEDAEEVHAPATPAKPASAAAAAAAVASPSVHS